jgi:hypothetical protein
MHGSRRNSEAAQRSQERRQKEDQAPRLSQEVPNLESLKLEISDGEQGMLGSVEHVRRVVVPSAPALFEIVCSNHSCKDGGHDLTSEIMRALRSGQERFEGSDACQGALGSSRCANVLTYVATATYKT